MLKASKEKIALYRFRSRYIVILLFNIFYWLTSKAAAYITHDATWLPTIFFEDLGRVFFFFLRQFHKYTKYIHLKRYAVLISSDGIRQNIFINYVLFFFYD